MESNSGYADDHVICSKFNSSSPENESATIQDQQNCIQSIKNWMSQNRLKMNDSKMEFILCGFRAQLAKRHTHQFQVGDTSITCSSKIKYLGVLLDSKLTL